MSGAPDETPVAREPSGGYIRGGGGVPTNAPHVLRVAFAVCFGLLAALTIALAVGAVHENARHRELQQHGVAVQVTVTNCLGTATGTGITVNGFTCRGSFVWDGHRHVDVIGGSSELLRPGAVLTAVVDPQSTSVLSVAPAARMTTASWRPFIRPAIPFAVLLAAAALGLWCRREGSRNPGADSTRSEDDGRSDTAKARPAPRVEAADLLGLDHRREHVGAGSSGIADALYLPALTDTAAVRLSRRS
jgi:hypothetical protein